ncbi:Essential protein Yae1, N terminal [Saitoella coloradoensis]
MDNDDVWGSDADDEVMETRREQEAHPTAKDWAALKELHSNQGYKDGIHHGRTSSAQPGFDAGYSTASPLGLRAGRLLGVLHSLHIRHPSDNAITELLDWVEEKLQDVEVFGKEYFEGTGREKYAGGAGGHAGIGEVEGRVREVLKEMGLEIRF